MKSKIWALSSVLVLLPGDKKGRERALIQKQIKASSRAYTRSLSFLGDIKRRLS